MPHYDVIVIGSGSGLTVMNAAARRGLKVALVEEGPMGGTCLNRGCIPSKMLIHSADVAQTIQEAAKFGITPKGYTVDFKRIVSRVSKIIDTDSADIEAGIREEKLITLYKGTGRFVSKNKLKVASTTLTGDKIVIFAGTRSFIPPINGIDKLKFLTSTEALRLSKLPRSMTIIGGGYIAAELAHFFGALGTKITILQRNPTLVPVSDPEIAERFTKIYQKKFNVLLNVNASKVERKRGKYVVTATGAKGEQTVVSDELLLATGRVPNSDRLDVAKAGIGTNKRGFISSNDFLETNVPNMWVGGDIAGKYLFKHSANLEAKYIVNNMFGEKKKKVEYLPMPWAVFGSPQIAGVGARESDLREGTYAVGSYEYKHTGMGAALQDEDGLAKIWVDRKTKKILGAQIIGHEASTLIHEVVMAMKCGKGTIDNISTMVHAHPALSEVVQRAALRVRL